MANKKESNIKLIKDNPSLSGAKLYELSKKKGIGIRKTDFYGLIRETRNLPEPTKEKRLKSTPTKFKPTPKPTPTTKPTRIKKLFTDDFNKTKFGKIANSLKKQHKISERQAIERTRKLLKVPKKDYTKLKRIDKFVLESHGY